MAFSLPLRKRLELIRSEIRSLRWMGIDPYGWMSGRDLELAINHGLLERDHKEEPTYDDR